MRWKRVQGTVGDGHAFQLGAVLGHAAGEDPTAVPRHPHPVDVGFLLGNGIEPEYAVGRPVPAKKVARPVIIPGPLQDKRPVATVSRVLLPGAW